MSGDTFISGGGTIRVEHDARVLWAGHVGGFSLRRDRPDLWFALSIWAEDRGCSVDATDRYGDHFPRNQFMVIAKRHREDRPRETAEVSVEQIGHDVTATDLIAALDRAWAEQWPQQGESV